MRRLCVACGPAKGAGTKGRRTRETEGNANTDPHGELPSDIHAHTRCVGVQATLHTVTTVNSDTCVAKQRSATGNRRCLLEQPVRVGRTRCENPLPNGDRSQSGIVRACGRSRGPEISERDAGARRLAPQIETDWRNRHSEIRAPTRGPELVMGGTYASFRATYAIRWAEQAAGAAAAARAIRAAQRARGTDNNGRGRVSRGTKEKVGVTRHERTGKSRCTGRVARVQEQVAQHGCAAPRVPLVSFLAPSPAHPRGPHE